MSQQLIFVRHSQVAVKPDRDSQQWELSEVGRERARLSAPQLAVHQAAFVVTSPEIRAYQTAEIIATTLGLPLQSNKDLREHDRRGMPFIPDLSRFRQTITRLLQFPDELVYGHETGREAAARCGRAVEALTAMSSETLILVTHGTILSLYLHHIANIDPVALWQQLKQPAKVVVNWPAGTIAEIIPAIPAPE